MPIEFERKYALRLNTPEKLFIESSDSSEDIEQIYLAWGKKQSARIRKSQIGNEFHYTFTFKQDVGKKTVEVETDLTVEDYNLLSRRSIMKFKKTRYVIGDWEIDFFKSDGKIYFVQAEIELPVKEKKPKEIPDFIKEHLIHVVKRGDGRFSSKKLGDPIYASRLMQTLVRNKK